MLLMIQAVLMCCLPFHQDSSNLLTNQMREDPCLTYLNPLPEPIEYQQEGISPTVGTPAYPFALYITTPPGSSFPGTFQIPIEGGNMVHRFKMRLEYIYVWSVPEPYIVMYMDHGTGTLSYVSADTNEIDVVGLPLR